MKKLFAVLVAMALVLAMGTTFAFAAGETGTITINNAVTGAVYEAYKMLDFEPSKTADQGIYTIADAKWDAFFETGEGSNYFVVTQQGDDKVVTLKEDVDDVDQTLAKAAIAYAKANSIAPTATAPQDAPATSPEETTVTFENLPLGYYAIDTSLGTLCAITNTNSNEDIWEKNGQPGIDKYVQEDSRATQPTGGWQKVNDADIGQVVNYKSTITVGEGVTNYVMHDKMEEGLEFIADSVEVKIGDQIVDASNYTVVVNPGDGDTFDIEFEDEFILGLAKNSEFTVYYSATLDEDAVIGNVENGNENEVYLSYGENNRWETSKDNTSTFTWKIDISKIDGETKDKLPGAEFELYNTDPDAEGATPIKLVKISDGSVADDGTVTPAVYEVYDGTAEVETTTTIVTDASGEFFVQGLDEGKYYLKETKAPDGYNMLSDPEEITITSTYDEADKANLQADYKVNNSTPAVIEIENNTGSLLPETGGIGTTIFTVAGILLMVVAVVLLVSKKRMSTFA